MLRETYKYTRRRKRVYIHIFTKQTKTKSLLSPSRKNASRPKVDMSEILLFLFLITAVKGESKCSFAHHFVIALHFVPYFASPLCMRFTLSQKLHCMRLHSFVPPRLLQLPHFKRFQVNVRRRTSSIDHLDISKKRNVRNVPSTRWISRVGG